MILHVLKRSLGCLSVLQVFFPLKIHHFAGNLHHAVVCRRCRRFGSFHKGGDLADHLGEIRILQKLTDDMRVQLSGVELGSSRCRQP